MPPTPMGSGRVRPTGVSIISVLYYIGAALVVIIGLLGTAALKSFVGGGSIINIGTTIFWAILLVIVAIQILIGWGLWTGKNWARITAIVFAALAILSGLSTIAKGGFVTIVIQGLYVWYLGFNASAKAYFK